MTLRDIITEFGWDARFLIHIQVTGSFFICDPAVTNTDRDFLLLVADLDTAGRVFSAEGWTNCFESWASKADTDPAKDVDEYNVEDKFGARFQAWRNGQENVIVTDDPTLHIRSVAATFLARELNLLDKKDRIALFRAVKYGEPYDGRLPR